MANLREIQRRMSSIKSTMQITRTMEIDLHGAHPLGAQEGGRRRTPYKEAITNMLANVASAGFDDSQPLLRGRSSEKNVLFILIASDRGLAGGFNLLQQRAVEHEMAELKAKGVSSEIITCGRKPTEYFTFRKVKPVMSFVGISSEPNQDDG